MSNEMVKATPQQELQQMFSTRKDALVELLPADVTPERFIRVVLNAAIKTPDIYAADKASLFIAATQCAQDGLLPDGKEAYLGTHRGKDGKVSVTYIPMIQGAIKRILASGRVRNLTSVIRYANDKFSWRIVNGEEFVEHEPYLDGDRGKRVGVYAVARLHDGSVFFEYMDADQVLHIARKSRAYNSEYGPWKQHSEQMWRKTVMHRLARRLPLDEATQTLIERDHALYDYDTPALDMPTQSSAVLAVLDTPVADVATNDDGDIFDAE